jgi:hypothetical protein
MRNQSIPRENGELGKTSIIELSRVRELVRNARAFHLAFVRVEKGARLGFNRLIATTHKYDLECKGILEYLLDDEGYLCGAVIHWPNGLETSYRRTPDGSKPMNLFPLDEGLGIMDGGRYAPHDPFSPLLRPGMPPRYTGLVGSGAPLEWSE